MEPLKPSFTPRETEVIGHLLHGKSNKLIALEMAVSNRAVEFHLSSIYAKLGVASRAEAIIRLKDMHLREPATPSKPAGLRQTAVEKTPASAQNGKQSILSRRSALKITTIIGFTLGLGGVLIALLLLRSSNERQAVADREPIRAAIPTATTIPPPTIVPPMEVPSVAPGSLFSGDHAAFAGETVLDGTQVDPGESFTKSWYVRNDGSVTWGADYAFAMVQSSHPLGQSLGEPAEISLPGTVLPGAEVKISIPLAAPETDGIYSAVYELRDGSGQAVEGDGARLWFSVVVGNPVIPASAQGGGVSMQLQRIQKDAATTSAEICAQYPDAQDWNPYPVILDAAGVSVSLDSYQLVGAKDPGTGSSSYRCFILGFPTGTDQYDSAPVTITIQSIAVDASTNLEANCARAQAQLAVSHPGLTFTCGSPGFYYSGVQVPAGMTLGEAEQVIMDALEQRIYGPWVFGD